MMKIWVTGSHGQVGSALLEELRLRGIDCLGTHREELDIADEARIRLYAKNCTHIVNAAGFTQVDPAEIEREKTRLANALGPKILAQAAREFGRPFLHLSTDYVFDGTLGRPYTEEDPPCPVNWYGMTKREGELYVLEQYPEACIVRTSWVFGGRGKQNYADRILQAMQQETELHIVKDQISCPTYVFDLASALVALLDQSGIYHYCNREPASRYDWTLAIWERAKAGGLPLRCERIVPVLSGEYSAKAKRPLATPLDTTKAGAILSIRSWREALEELFTRGAYDF